MTVEALQKAKETEDIGIWGHVGSVSQFNDLILEVLCSLVG